MEKSNSKTVVVYTASCMRGELSDEIENKLSEKFGTKVIVLDGRFLKAEVLEVGD